MNPKGTIVFTTVGRPYYGFDVFCVQLPSNPHNNINSEHRRTDGTSINFNAQFVNNQDESIVFISERSGAPRIYLTRPGSSKPQQLPFIPSSLFHDRPIVKNDNLYFVSAHEQPDQQFKSWSALYSTNLNHNNNNEITRLTPYGVADYSPSVSQSGKFIAVASYGSRTWAGEFHELATDIVVFEESDPENRVTVCERGGWPSWSGDTSIYFHRQADDGWWSIFSVDFPDNHNPTRVTPPGVHCFTPAAFHDGKRLAVATRRKNNKFRHIEIFDLESKVFSSVTESLNPNFHHYNPFVNSGFLGYHRFRGAADKSIIPHLDPVMSPIKEIRMFRLNGSFPSFSPNGEYIAINHDFDSNAGMKVIKSDGSKRWTLIKDRTAFYNSWSPTEKHVIYTSIGPIFQSSKTTVQIARISFSASNLTVDREEIPCDVKILTRNETGNNAFPSCSPDGKSLVFRSGRSGYKNLYILDDVINGEVNGGGNSNSIRQLTDGPWIDTMPCWSPIGDLIAFSSNRHNPDNNDAFSIYVVKPDGSGLQRIHVSGCDRERINHVCFSGDGEWLLFTANLGGVTAEPVSWPNQFQPYGDLYVMRLDGTGLRRLTWNGYENGTPMWYTGSESGVDLGNLCLEDVVGDRLEGQFDEPLWISTDF